MTDAVRENRVVGAATRDEVAGTDPAPAAALARFTPAVHAAGPTTRPAGGTGLGPSVVRSLAPAR